MPQDSLLYAVTRAKVLEGRLIGQERLQRLADAPTAADALKVLADYGYGDADPNADPADYEKYIDIELEQAAAFMHEVTTDERMTDLLLLRGDYQNAKAWLKMKATGASEPRALTPVCRYGARALEGIVSGAPLETAGLPAHLTGAIARTQAEQEKNRDPRGIDVSLDKAYLAYMLGSAQESGDEGLREYCAGLIDLYNVAVLVRARLMEAEADVLKAALAPGGVFSPEALTEAAQLPDEGLIARFSNSIYGGLGAAIDMAITRRQIWRIEKYRDNWLMQEIKRGRNELFTILPLLGYMAAKEAEARAVRLVMAAKVNGIDAEAMRERLRDLYE